ncbi:MAG: hypothetical protein HUJ98_07000 [Bacteroidaceae bacterium]|nr:hypothetical protein [Bacteroidaceae bacterium]
MNKIFSKSTLLAGVLVLAGCNNNEPTTPKEEPTDSNLISFSVDQDAPSSRTQYSPNHWNRIEWVMGDQVKIWCKPANADIKTAMYKVHKRFKNEVTIDGHKIDIYNKAIISSVGEGHKWADSQAHTFYATYGESADIYINTDGSPAAKLKYPTTQTLSKCGNGAWANMQYAYMVATTTASKPTNTTQNTDNASEQTEATQNTNGTSEETDPMKNMDVPLTFYPVMTTLDIEVKGTGVENVPLTVQSLSITTHASSAQELYDDVLYDVSGDTYFDINFGSSGPIDPTGQTTIKGLKRTITFEFATPQVVQPNESFLVTVNIPRIAIGGDKGKPIDITVNTTDESHTFKFGKDGAPSAGIELEDIVPAGYKAKIITQSLPAPKPDGSVDLGLSVKWASCNLGASKPEEYGDYYGWGCISPYVTGTTMDNVNWSLYFNKLGGTGTQASDCGESGDPLHSYVGANARSIAGTEWDAATKELGSNWHIPTSAQIKELINKDNCDWVWTTDYLGDGTGIKGYKVTSKKEGYTDKSIFLPVVGRRDGTGYYEKPPFENGYYWCSQTPQGSNAQRGLNMKFDKSSISEPGSSFYSIRYYGLAIRPVKDK